MVQYKEHRTAGVDVMNSLVRSQSLLYAAGKYRSLGSFNITSYGIHLLMDPLIFTRYIKQINISIYSVEINQLN
jgi:predicted oxidoreductase